MVTDGRQFVEEVPFAVLPVEFSFVCFVLVVLFSISAAAALAAVVEAFVNAPVTDELAIDIGFKPLADALDVEYDDDDGCAGGVLFCKSLVLEFLLLLFEELFLLLLVVLSVSLLVGIGVGVVLVDVVVVVISLKVEPAIDTIGVSGIIAAAKEETATATTAAAFGGVVTGKWLLALTTAAMALTVTSNCADVEYDSGANDDKDDNDDIDENDVAAVVQLLVLAVE